jgi:hypothetical protein
MLKPSLAVYGWFQVGFDPDCEVARRVGRMAELASSSERNMGRRRLVGPPISMTDPQIGVVVAGEAAAVLEKCC